MGLCVLRRRYIIANIQNKISEYS